MTAALPSKNERETGAGASMIAPAAGAGGGLSRDREPMEPFAAIYHAVDRLSTEQAAAAGGIGSGISIVTVMSIDPVAWTPWLQIATLSVGLITGLASLALVVMKLVQQRRAMRSG